MTKTFSERCETLFGGRELQTLTHALEVAAARFDEDAKTMELQKAESERQLNARPGSAIMFHPSACDRLAAQFRTQAADARALLYKVRGDDEPEDEEELELEQQRGRGFEALERDLRDAHGRRCKGANAQQFDAWTAAVAATRGHPLELKARAFLNLH